MNFLWLLLGGLSTFYLATQVTANTTSNPIMILLAWFLPMLFSVWSIWELWLIYEDKRFD